MAEVIWLCYITGFMALSFIFSMLAYTCSPTLFEMCKFAVLLTFISVLSVVYDNRALKKPPVNGSMNSHVLLTGVCCMFIFCLQLFS